MWLCITNAPHHISSVVSRPQCVSVWSRVAGSHFFKSALSVPDIKDTMLNLFDHEKSTYIQGWFSDSVLPALCSHHQSLLNINITYCKYDRNVRKALSCKIHLNLKVGEVVYSFFSAVYCSPVGICNKICIRIMSHKQGSLSNTKFWKLNWDEKLAIPKHQIDRVWMQGLCGQLHNKTAEGTRSQSDLIWDTTEDLSQTRSSGSQCCAIPRNIRRADPEGL